MFNRRPRLRALVIVAVLLPAAVSANPPDGLLPLPPKPGAKADILPDLPTPTPRPTGPGAPPPLPPLPGHALAPGLPPLPVWSAPQSLEHTSNSLPEMPGSTPVAAPVVPPIPYQPRRPAPPPPPPVKYVSKPDVEFDFEITKQGRSGVKAVSLWMQDPAKQMPDDSNALPALPTAAEAGELAGWQEVAQKPVGGDGGQKLRYRMTADGRYWFLLRVTGTNDRKSSPKAHNGNWVQPDLEVVLDTEPPVVRDVRFDLLRPGEAVAMIRWQATDANLGANCVTVEYEDSGGKWVGRID